MSDKKPEPIRKLNARERAFVDEFLITRNATRAYQTAFPNVTYASAREMGLRYRHRPHVAAEIEAGIRDQSLRSEATADLVIKELAAIATADIVDLYDLQGNLLHPRNIPFHRRKAVREFTVERTRTTTTIDGKKTTTVTEETVNVELHDKLAAIEKLAKHLGLHESIPPIDRVIASFPADLADAVRTELKKLADQHNQQSTTPTTTPPTTPTWKPVYGGGKKKR